MFLTCRVLVPLLLFPIPFQLESLRAPITLLKWWSGDLCLQWCSRPYPFLHEIQILEQFRSFASTFWSLNSSA